MVQVETGETEQQHFNSETARHFGSKERKKDSLADQQQINLGRVDQIYVGKSIHSFQTRVDTTVQLQDRIAIFSFLNKTFCRYLKCKSTENFILIIHFFD